MGDMMGGGGGAASNTGSMDALFAEERRRQAMEAATGTGPPPTSPSGDMMSGFGPGAADDAFPKTPSMKTAEDPMNWFKQVAQSDVGKMLMERAMRPKKKNDALGNIMKVAAIGAMFMSDKDAKTHVTPVTGDRELRAVESLPVARWSYKGDHAPHIGPMAQDFQRAFGVGSDPRMIHAVDASGVTIAALQQLARRVRDLERGPR